MAVASHGHDPDTGIGRPGPEPIVLQAGTAERLNVPGDDFIVSAEYERTGNDLIVNGADGGQVVVRDYFTATPPPLLVSDSGTQMSPGLVATLVGPLAPGQYAQAGGAPSPIQAVPIGRVEISEGSATATRTDGTVVGLVKDSTVFKGDIVRTSADAKLGIVLVDKTTFALGENARMVMNEMVYDPAAAAQGSFFGTLLQGTFVFVTGEIAKAKPENFIVDTPFAVIGVRGTKVGVVVESNTVQVSEGSTSISHKLTGLSYTVDAGFGVSLPPSGVPQIVPMSLTTLGAAIQSLDINVSQPMTPFSRNPTGNSNSPNNTPEGAPGDGPGNPGDNPRPDGDPATEPGPGRDGANRQTGGEAGLAPPGIAIAETSPFENFKAPEFVSGRPPSTDFGGRASLPNLIIEENDAPEGAPTGEIAQVANSQTVGFEVFLQGTFIELGVSAAGTLGTLARAPDGFHASLSDGRMSTVIDLDSFGAGQDSGSTRSGDFTLPGVPIESYTIGYRDIAGGAPVLIHQNGAASLNTLNSVTVDNSFGNVLSTVTSGAAGNISMIRDISFDADQLSYAVTLIVTNISGSEIFDVRYLHNMNVDVDSDVFGNVQTKNDVLLNTGSDSSDKIAIAQAVGPESGLQINLIGIGTEYRVSNFGLNNISPYDSSAFDIPVDGNGISVDESISMAISFGNLFPGETQAKRYFVSFNSANIGSDV